MKTVNEPLPERRMTFRRWGIVGLLLLAAFVRLHRLDSVSVTNATAFQELTAAEAMSFGGWNWVLAGPPTEEIRSSALLPTLIAIARTFWWHPLSGTCLLVVLNIAAVAVFFRMCVEQFGNRVAFCATFLYATSTWATLYSRLLLPAGCLALFSVVLLQLSLKWLDQGGGLRLAAATVFACAMPQVHFSGLSALLWFIAVLLVGRRQISWTGLGFGLVGGLIVWLPWLRFQQITGWNELTAWGSNLLQQPGAHALALRDAAGNLVDMVRSAGFEYWFGGGSEGFVGWSQTTFRVALTVFGGALVLMLLAGSMVKPPDTKQQVLVRLLVAWVLLPIATAMLLRTGSNPANLAISLPAAFAVIATVTVPRAGVRWKSAGILLVAIVVVAGGLQLCSTLSCGNYVTNIRNSSAGAYELSFRQRQHTIQSLIADANDRPLLVLGGFSGWYPSYQYLLTYESVALVNQLDLKRGHLVYWIDEEPPPDEMRQAAWNAQKERELNQRISQHLLTAPDWAIDRHWSVGPSQIYRMRFVDKEPLQ